MAFVRDVAYFAACWVAFRLYLVLPIDWRISWAILPSAGMYAYSESYRDFRLCAAWNRDGRPDVHPYLDFLAEAA